MDNKLDRETVPQYNVTVKVTDGAYVSKYCNYKYNMIKIHSKIFHFSNELEG